MGNEEENGQRKGKEIEQGNEEVREKENNKGKKYLREGGSEMKNERRTEESGGK